MIKAGIIGAAGYTGGELLRLLAYHPNVELAFAQSESCAGKKISEIHRDLFGLMDLCFTSSPEADCEILFLCKGHHESRAFLNANKIDDTTKVIDLSQDFRHQENSQLNGRTFIYGLPEANRDLITTAYSIANPGCFATAIQLSLLPLAANKCLPNNVHINATTGSTGAGQSFSESSHFSRRSNNHSVYKALTHQHLKEINETLKQIDPELESQLHFIPQRGAFTRGIHAISQIQCDLSIQHISDLYSEYYSHHPFVHLVPFETDVKQVVNSNNCFIHLEKHEDQLVITTVIDNLLKGASGQALQNMNLLFGLPETTGLKLKSTAF